MLWGNYAHVLYSLCMGVAVPLRVVPSPTGLPSKRGPGLGFRSLVRKGKVGLRGPGIPGVGGTGQGPGSVPLLAVLVSVLEEEGRGGMGRRAQGSPASGGNQKGRLSAALSPLLKLHVGMPRWVQWFGCHASLQRARLLRSKRYTAWLDKFLFLIKIIKLPQWRDPVPFLGSRGH